ncbi:hypothetical protein [Oceanobacillus jeddahense]|uniref:hypothetical protein n=1 Tax=Oceanobacillus jeddahense TaxID=1462527 RepID=UPI00059632E8|nr:hypothetical protein [Oceanobacillus jeddahense]
MKKYYFLAALVSFFLVLTACSNDSDENGTEDNDAAAPETDQQETGETDDIASEEEELLEGALDALNGIDQRYEEATITLEMSMDEELEEELGEEENVETDSSTTMDMRSWQMNNEDGSVSERTEIETDGGPVEYSASEDSETSINYTEGDETAYEVEMVDMGMDPADVRMEEEQIRELMNTYEVSYEGETSVNEYDVHHFVFTNGEEEIEYYFDTETFVIVQMDMHANNDEMVTHMEVQDYALDFDYDEGFFRLEDVLDDSIEVEQVDPDELMEEQLDEDLEDGETEDNEE